MNDLANKTIGIMGLLFGLLVIGFTGFQTYSLLFETSGNHITAVIGLVLFEGGMLYWWLVFQKHAEGIYQMAISLIMAVFGLLLVVLATGLHLGALGGEFLGTNTAAKVIVIAAIINLMGKFTFPLFAPETFNRIWQRALEGKISLRAFRDAEGKADDMAAELADRIGREITRRLEVDMLTHFGLTHDLERKPEIIPLPSPNGEDPKK